jgi:triosephosphate isomerase
MSGAFTGDVSAEMLKDDGATAVIVGHSERRRLHAETNDIVAAKATAAKRAGLMAIICVGESERAHQSGESKTFCGQQIVASVPPGMTAGDCAIAYEPLWAVGSDQAAAPHDISDMHAYIRRTLIAHLGPTGASVRILYGGSVTAANAAQILALPDVNGVLVGRESLAFVNFEGIVDAAPTHHNLQRQDGDSP